MEMTIKYIGNNLMSFSSWNCTLVYCFVQCDNGSLLFLLTDPTYMIRAIPSNASDNVYCTLLAHSAIHGAMAGYSFTVGMVNGRHAYIPFHVSVTFVCLFFRAISRSTAFSGDMPLHPYFENGSSMRLPLRGGKLGYLLSGHQHLPWKSYFASRFSFDIPRLSTWARARQQKWPWTMQLS
jgi:hypothetical protein